MISLMWNLRNKTKEQRKKERNQKTDPPLRNKAMVSRGKVVRG